MDALYLLRETPEAAQNPRWLKHEGIRRLQHMVGDVWSHYNDIDPGVTLLEHLCWALSEVAYCADFPLEDLLTGADGHFAVPGQFAPQAEILSHQAVNDDDYGRLLFDRLPDLRALRLVAECDRAGHPSGRQHCYLAARPDLDDNAREALRQSAWCHLRQWRLPGQDFLEPVWLTSRPLALSARLLVADAQRAGALAETCRLRLDQLAAPIARQEGYHRWQAEGLDGAQIIDGPRLERGWMPQGSPQLPDSVRSSAVAALLAGIEGVQTVLELRLSDGASIVQRVALAPHQIVDWTLDLEIWCDGRCCLRLQDSSTMPGVAAMQAAHAGSGIGAGIDVQAPLPRGQYRDLASYHPVQATLPANWGMTGREVDQTPQQQAHTRQLAGYLLPFEQMLSNQFAQLAHLGELFSPASPPLPERGGRPEDVPWQVLARTNFSQPLYQIPGIDALLAGQQLFDVWLGEPRPQEAWRAARDFSHNPYRHALATLTESEHEAMQRRLAALRHQMARHGEDASAYDAMILACQWYGSRERTLSVAFSLWLQNLCVLSEARCCGARYPAPPLCLPGDPAMPHACPALNLRLAPQPGLADAAPGAPWWERLLAWPERNGQPDLPRIEALARLNDKSLDGYGSFELKAGLLLDLPARFCALAAQLLRALYAPGARQWLRTARQGGARFALPGCETYLYARTEGLWLCEGRWQDGHEAAQALLDIAWPEAHARAGWPATWRLSDAPGPGSLFPAGDADEEAFLNCHAHAWQLLWLATQRKGVLLVEPVLLGAAAPSLCAHMVWPDWVLLLRERMAGFVDTLRERHWPAHVDLLARGASFAQLAALIPPFVAWHNAYGHGDATAEGAELAKLLDDQEDA